MGQFQFRDLSGLLHTGILECASGPGLVVYTEWSLHPLVIRSLSGMGDSGSGLVHVNSEQEVSSVLFSSSQSDGLAGTCLPSFLGQSGCLHFSPIQSNQDSHQLPNDVPITQNDPDRSMMATSRVISVSFKSLGGRTEHP